MGRSTWRPTYGPASRRVRFPVLNARPSDPLDSPEWGDALEAVESANDDVEGMGLLLRALERGDLLTKRAAARRLAELATPAAVVALGRMINDDDRDVRTTATSAVRMAAGDADVGAPTS